MRTLYALLALVVLGGGILTAQSNSDRTQGRSPALPPEPPPPLYMPNQPGDLPRRLGQPPTEDEVQRLLAARQRSGAVVTVAADVAGQAEGSRQTEAVDEFKPISEIPPEDRLPSAPMLIGAYAFVMLAIFAYMISLSRRLNAVARDLAKLDAQTRRS